MNDTDYMNLALELARRGMGWTSPNPMVGAVLVKNGEIIGQGWHTRYGELHAEREALKNCTGSPAGATLYVTLEPCCHQGRQPPCTQAILDAGITRVVVGSNDPNPLVAGKGLNILRAHGVQVETGVCKQACDALNQVFFHFITTRRPYVVLKYAMTMDGKIATRTGASKWITGETARKRVHEDRHRYRAIYEAAGCQVWMLPERGEHVDLAALMDRLGAENIDSVLLEGGGTLNWSALEQGLVQKVQAYIASKLFGGGAAKSPVEGLGVETPDQAVRLINTTITPLGDDFLLESEVEHHVYRDR